MQKIKLSPSIMCADLLNIQRELDIFGKHRIDLLHIDVMDGHYVPNLTFGTDFCKSLSQYSSIPLDIHLMIENVDQYLEKFCCFAGASVSFHPETTWHPIRTIERIKSLNCKVGIALNTSVSIEQHKELYKLVDFVVVMTVTPGFAGQKLIPFCLEKTKRLREYFKYNGIRADIEVDGNVSWQNIPSILDAGATILVNGSSSIFDERFSRGEAIMRVRRMLETFERGQKKTVGLNN